MNGQAEQPQQSGAMQLNEVLGLVFPNGTNAPAAQAGAGATADWETIPALAADLFGFCGYVVQLTGMMGFFEADPDLLGARECHG